MDGGEFREELASCELSYVKMVGKLRMEGSGAMSLPRENRSSQTPIKEI